MPQPYPCLWLRTASRPHLGSEFQGSLPGYPSVRCYRFPTAPKRAAQIRLVGKAVGAVKNTKTAAKIASATSKVKDKTAGLASKAIEKVKASRAASKVASTKKSVNTPAAKSRNIKIKGYTKHGINQAISHDGKGVKPSSIIHAVKYGTAKIQKNGTIRYTSEQASVVLNAMQKVVSAWAKSSKYWRK